MVGPEHDLIIVVILCQVDITEGRLQCVRARRIDCLHGHVVGFLEVALCFAAVACALRVGRDILGVLEPPCIGKICL